MRSNVLSLSLLIVVGACSVVAQQNQYDKATPPQHAAGVSPLGSYSSEDLDGQRWGTRILAPVNAQLEQ
jgi:hypothetical protein